MGPNSRNFDFLKTFEPELARLGALAEWAFHQDAPTALGKLRQFAEHMAKSMRAQLVATETATEKARREAGEAALARLDAEALARREAEERAQWEQLAAEEAAARDDVQRTLERLRAEAQSQTPAIIAKLSLAAETADAAIELDEADTRVLIDAKLAAAGWTVDSARLRHGAGTRPDSAPAIAIAEWPTATGPVDYALFLDGRCVGLIEAKRGKTEFPGVLIQTGRYAAGVTLAQDQRLPPALAGDAPGGAPFLFATNGRPCVKQMLTKSGVWFRDARRSGNLPLPLSDWFTPQDLREKLAQTIDGAGLAAESFDYAGIRPYQQEAIKAIEEAIGRGQREILVAMATGTGKTRTCIALMYRVLKHKRFRRILFLVDRNELGKQTLRALANTAFGRPPRPFSHEEKRYMSLSRLARRNGHFSRSVTC